MNRSLAIDMLATATCGLFLSINGVAQEIPALGIAMPFHPLAENRTSPTAIDFEVRQKLDDARAAREVQDTTVCRNGVCINTVPYPMPEPGRVIDRAEDVAYRDFLDAYLAMQRCDNKGCTDAALLELPHVVLAAPPSGE